MDNRELHAHLIGQQNLPAALNTPVLVPDFDALNSDITKMAALTREKHGARSLTR